MAVFRKIATICDRIYEKGSSTHILFTNFDDS